MLAKATGTSAVTVKGKIYCGFIDNQDSFNCKGDDGGACRLKNSYYYEPVTLKPGNTVRIKEYAEVWTIHNKELQEGYSFNPVEIDHVLGSLVCAGGIIFHESAISEIIQQQPEKMITVKGVEYSEDTLALMVKAYTEKMDN